MIDERDATTKELIDHLSPRWRELRVRKRHFVELESGSIKVASAIFVGESFSLLCAVDPKDVSGHSWEYFPIAFRVVQAESYAPDEWITLAKAGGVSVLDRKLQWLFETPLLTLTELVEEFGRGEGVARESWTYKFYNGLEISDFKGHGALRLTACDLPDSILTIEFNFGPNEP
jgi:hypothetical protein